MVMELPNPRNLDGFIPSESDMKTCPLCLEKFKVYEEPGKKGRIYFFCLKDMVSIHIQDPMLGRWKRVESEPCPNCMKEPMRLFFRVDGYIKMKCNKCGCVVENVDPQKHDAMMKFEESKGKRKTVHGEKDKDGKAL